MPVSAAAESRQMLPIWKSRDKHVVDETANMSDSEESTLPLNKRQRVPAPAYNDRSEDEMVTPLIMSSVLRVTLQLML